MVCIPKPGESRHERHMAFIEANLAHLAAAAQDGYVKQGRGMLLLNDADFVDKPRGVLTRYRRCYVGENSDQFEKPGGWPGEKEARWVKEYDPHTTMLISMARTNGVSSYRIRFREERINTKEASE